MTLIYLVITPREKDLGSFSVHRVLPSVKRRMVGPFIFFDHMGPASFAACDGIDVFRGASEKSPNASRR